MIECGTQACGGFSTDWLELPDNGNIGYPIVEVSNDGSDAKLLTVAAAQAASNHALPGRCN